MALLRRHVCLRPMSDRDYTARSLARDRAPEVTVRDRAGSRPVARRQRLRASAWVGFAIAGRDPASAAWSPLHMLVIAGSIGIAAGLIGLHALQQHHVGASGTAGHRDAVRRLPPRRRRLASRWRRSPCPSCRGCPPARICWWRSPDRCCSSGWLALGVAIVRGGVFPLWTGAALVVAAIAGAFAAYVRIPLALHMSISALGGLILAYLGLLVVLASSAVLTPLPGASVASWASARRRRRRGRRDPRRADLLR
jgi:hypothetical protein